jgi:hypothetical protein
MGPNPKYIHTEGKGKILTNIFTANCCTQHRSKTEGHSIRNIEEFNSYLEENKTHL